MQPTVLFEDSRVIAVLKKSGELVHNSAHAGPIERTLRQRVMDASDRALFPLHRLDRGTSGVVIFAKERADVCALSEALQRGTKKYVALVRGHFFGAAWIDHALTNERGVAQAAKSSVRELARCRTQRISAVEILLVTGRTHQIRRHLKHLSHPLIGDVKYGKGEFNRLARETYGFGRLALHARQVTLDLDDTSVDICAPLPDDFQNFCDVLFDDDKIRF